MKCLNEMQHELLIINKAGIRKTIWQIHLQNCEQCQVKHTEIKDNLKFSDNIKEDIKGI